MTRHQVLSVGFLLAASLWALGDQLASMPLGPSGNQSGAVLIERSDDGQFVAEAMVEGAPVRFIVDTGATMVALTARDARRAGFSPESLEFDRIAVTPAGATAVAIIRLNELRLGGMSLRNIDAAVTSTEEGYSLLGLNALAALEHVEIRGDTLTLGR